ncbi:MAG: hypothetical protein JST85_22425 [Acidobacteria bacterium]|nr:hypothetical protein [Acidobacteriota bacterium]
MEAKKESVFYIPYHIVTEAVFSGIEFDKLLQREVNRFLIKEKIPIKIKIHPGSVEASSPRFSLMSEEYEKAEITIECPAEQIFRNDLKAAIANILQAYRQYQLLEEENRNSLPEKSHLNLLTDELDKALSELCDSYILRICKCIGKDTILKHVAFGGKDIEVSISLGFHFTAKGADRVHTHFKYYSVCGWTLHRAVISNLHALKSSYQPDSTNLEFILSVLLIMSMDHSKTLPLVGNIIKEDPDSPLELIGYDLRTLLDKYLPDEERKRWKAVADKLSLISNGDFENILRTLLLFNEWKQKTDIGIFAERLVSEGDEIIVSNYAIEYKGRPQGATSRDWWNYSVATRIEDFFIGSEWLKGFKIERPVKAYLIACPIFFREKLLGDFFITGTYFEGDEDIVRDNFIPLATELTTFLKDEFEYLAKVIMSFKFYDYASEQALSLKLNQTQLVMNMVEVFDLPPGEVIWGNILEPLTPIGRKIADYIKVHSTSAAVAAVMARNLSHNIGSHVMFYIEARAERITKELNRYLRDRMDFIADVTTSVPAWEMPMMIYGDIIRPLSSDFLKQLKETIAASEGITNIDFKFYIGSKEVEQQGQADAMYVSRDAECAIVSGLTGIQAFYSIIENLIRNGAKHNPYKSSDMKVSVRIDDENNAGDQKYIRVRVWEDITNCDQVLLDKINYYIKRPFIDESGTPDLEGLGIKEMRACAAFLRGLSPREAGLGTNDISPPLLRVHCLRDGGEEASPNWKLVYEFFLPKSKEALIIDYDLSLNNNLRLELSTHGIYIDRTVGDETSGLASHYLLVINQPDELEFSTTNQNTKDSLPCRMVLVGKKMAGFPEAVTMNEDTYKALTACLPVPESYKGVLLELYYQWISEFYKISKLSIVINLAQEKSKPLESADLISDWVEIEADFNRAFGKQRLELKFVPDMSDFDIPECPFVVYDRHQALKVNGSFNSSQSSGEKPSFYEGITAGRPNHNLFFSLPPDKYLRLNRVLRLIEAALTRVLIVDERVYKQISQQNLSKDLKESNLFVADGFNYNHPDDEDQLKLLKKVEDCYFHALVIHQGILDKMTDNNVERIQEFVGLLRERVPFVVVVSGRGTPVNVPGNARFAGAAGVLQFAVGQRSKYHLTQLLLSSRKARRIDVAQ